MLSTESTRKVFEKTSVVSGTMKISVQSRHPKPFHPLNHQHKEVEGHRGKGPQRPESMWEVRSTAVQRLPERYLHQITL